MPAARPYSAKSTYSMAVPSQQEKVARQNWLRPSLVARRSSAASAASAVCEGASVVSLMAVLSSFILRLEGRG